MTDRRKRQRPTGKDRRIYDRRRHRGPLRILWIDLEDAWWRFIRWMMVFHRVGGGLTITSLPEGFQEGDIVTFHGFENPKHNGTFQLVDAGSQLAIKRLNWWQRFWVWLKERVA